MADRLISITTAFAVATITAVAAVISYRHAYGWSVPHGGPPDLFRCRVAPAVRRTLIYGGGVSTM